MNFQAAVKTCLGKYATFSGRAMRSEFWWFWLFILIVQAVLMILDGMLFGTGEVVRGPGSFSAVSHGGPLSGLFSLAMLLPMLAVAVRRLHDVGKSGWWLLIALIPLIGALVLLYFYVQPSQPGSNQFGAPPASGVPPVPMG